MATPTAALPIIGAGTVASRQTTGLVLGLASSLAFASSGSFMKPLMEGGWSIGATLLVRMSVAALVLSPALVLAIRADRGLLRRQWRLVVGFGLTGVVGCQLFYFASMQRMPVAVSLLVQYLAPVLLVGLAWARTRRAPSGRVAAGSLAAIAGLILVVDVVGARFDLVGTLFALLSAACLAAYFLLSERAGDGVPPLALAAGGLLVGAIGMGALVVTGVLPFAAPAIDVVLGGVTVPWVVPVAWVALVATALSYALSILGVARMGSRVGSFVGLTEVLFAVVIAWLILGEAPTAVQLAGGALILAGVVLVKSAPAERPL